jgi:hypothetical protein
MGRYAFLAGCHEMKAQYPLRQWNVAALHDGTNRHSEMLAALIADMQAFTMGFAVKLCDLILVGIAAMGAVRAIGPADGLKMLAGLVLVVKNGVCEVRHNSKSF